MTTLTALARPGTLLNPGPLRRGFLVGFFGMLAAGIMVLSAASIAVGVLSAGRVMPGVQVAGVDIGGLNRAAAVERLNAELPSLSSGSLTVNVDGSPVQVPYAELARAYEMEAMLASAFDVARSGNLVADAFARLDVLTEQTRLPAMSGGSDAAALERAVDALLARFAIDPVDATVTYDPAAGYTVSPATDGAQLDAAAVSDALSAALVWEAADTSSISLSTTSIAPDVTTVEAKLAALSAESMSATKLSLRGGDRRFALKPPAIAGLLSFETVDGTLLPVIDEAGLEALIAPLAKKVAATPRDASFTWGASGITGVVPGRPGRELDVAASVGPVLEALRARGDGAVQRTAALAVVTTQPALSTKAAKAAAPEMRRLSTWTTFYVPGESNYWGANISIPANDLDGLVIAPGEWFSFWNDIGPVTFSRGYGYGGVIINGRSQPTGALAGGICSTSTTLFNAAMRFGLEIGDRVNHSYYIERYPVGLDATVLKTDTWAQDMTFRNDTDNPIVIRSYTGTGFVRFDIWGVSDGRTVQLSAPITSNHRAAVDTTVVNPSLRPGTAVRVESPHNGFSAVVTRWVRDGDGNLLHEDVWTSHYRTVNGIIEVGPARSSGGGGGGGDNDNNDA